MNDRINALPNDDEKWQAIVHRDAAYDNKFCFGVMTTGVYCRPSCAARRPNRKNVRFYLTPQVAQRDHLRACKRCKPDVPVDLTPTLAKLLDLCRHIEKHADSAHSLTALAKRVQLSQFQVHRMFKAFLQITPKKYIEQVRVAALKRKLRSASSVTEAIYDAGFESSSAVYGRLDAHLGMTPRDYRRGGEGVNISFAFGRTALGLVLIGATDRGICYLQFGDSERELLEQLAEEYPRATIAPSTTSDDTHMNLWMTALNARLQGKRTKAQLPLDIQGTAFQKRVWEFLQSIPQGDVISYQEVAQGIGAPKAIRAAASACASNHIGVLIPCHRVIRGNGELGGYRWGLPRKRALIDMERRRRHNKKEER